MFDQPRGADRLPAEAGLAEGGRICQAGSVIGDQKGGFVGLPFAVDPNGNPTRPVFPAVSAVQGRCGGRKRVVWQRGG
jgi:hypothetical protein